ncbi:hypothetical protein Bca101_062011 [Brassica carinata]
MSPPPLKKTKKRSSLTAGVEPPQEDSIAPPSLSLTSLPDEIIFNCLTRVPRCYYQNLRSVSKTLRSLVNSPELHRLRSFLPNKPKGSVYILFHVDKTPLYFWFTLRETEKTSTTTTKIEYRLVPYSTPIRSKFMYRSCTIALGPEIFFVGGYIKPSTKLWILNTRSGDLTKGPNMNVARTCEAIVESIDGKVYVMGGCDDDDIQAEVFDPNSREWTVAESKKKLQPMRRLRASVNGKVYMVKGEKIVVYDPRKGQRFKKVKMPSGGGRHGGGLFYMCAVADVLYCYYFTHGLMGFDAKLKVWRRVVGLEKLGVAIFHNAATVEYDGKLAIFWHGSSKKDIRCVLIMLDLIGDVIRGTIEWCVKLFKFASFVN